MQNPSAFHAEMMGDIMYYDQALPPKDKFQIWRNYFHLQIKLICISYNYLFLFGSFVVLTKIKCLIFCFLIKR
jgi:hypothetical protein